MAASNAFQSIVLRESDVPGAKLVYESIEKTFKYSVTKMAGMPRPPRQKQAIGVNSFKGKLFCFDTFHGVTLKCVKDSFSHKGLLFAKRTFIFAKRTSIMSKTIY